MGIVLGPNQYGKAENRVVRIYRDSPRHEIRDVNVSTSLRGDFSAAHLTGDQGQVLPTDTQKNTAYAFAKEKGLGAIEEYALALARHFVDDVAPVNGARVEVDEYFWDRIEVDGNCDGITTSGLFNLKIKINGTSGTVITVAQVMASLTAGATNRTWSFHGLLYVESVGSGGAMSLNSFFVNRIAAGTTQAAAQQDTAVAVALTSPYVISLVAGMQTANAGNVFRVTHATVSQVV